MSDFTFSSREAEFHWQHHARSLSENSTHTIISVFDNEMQNTVLKANIDDPLPTSRGIILSLDHKARVVDLVGEFIHPLHDVDHELNAYTFARGSVQVLENENVLVGWSNHLLHSEYTPDGDLLRWGHIIPNIGM